MAAISIASDKDVEAALDGYRVCIHDSDINQQAAAFGSKAKVPGLTVMADVNGSNILAALRSGDRFSCDCRSSWGCVGSGPESVSSLPFRPHTVATIDAGRGVAKKLHGQEALSTHRLQDSSLYGFIALEVYSLPTTQLYRFHASRKTKPIWP